MADIELLAVVALLEDVNGHGIARGQVGTVVEMLGPNVYEVEFSDDNGQTYASVALRAEQVEIAPRASPRSCLTGRRNEFRKRQDLPRRRVPPSEPGAGVYQPLTKH
jgi:hypothetical protein